MENIDLKNKTIKQLRSNISVYKTISIALVVVLTLLTGIAIYGLIAKDNVATFIALFAVACTSWSFVPLPFNAIKKIKTELDLRAHIS